MQFFKPFRKQSKEEGTSYSAVEVDAESIDAPNRTGRSYVATPSGWPVRAERVSRYRVWMLIDGVLLVLPVAFIGQCYKMVYYEYGLIICSAGGHCCEARWQRCEPIWEARSRSHLVRSDYLSSRFCCPWGQSAEKDCAVEGWRRNNTWRESSQSSNISAMH